MVWLVAGLAVLLAGTIVNLINTRRRMSWVSHVLIELLNERQGLIAENDNLIDTNRRLGAAMVGQDMFGGDKPMDIRA